MFHRIFIYGGNLGQPWGIPSLMQCLEDVKHREDCHFVVVGTGTYLPKLMEWYEKDVNDNHNDNFSNTDDTNRTDKPETRNLKHETRPLSVTVMKGLPKEEYDQLV